MRAITRSVYGPARSVIELVDADVPEVKDREVLVRVVAASVNAGDVALVRGSPYLIRPVYGLRRPRQPGIGQDVAGVVERVGEKVTRIRPGDEVFGGGFATFSEYAAAPEKRLARKPQDLSFETAAALPIAGLTALQGIRDAGGVRPGQRVLINGASGGVGTFAVQVAKALGAEVTAVCSTRHVEQARAIGADHVIDYTIEDFTETKLRFDVVFDNAASKSVADTRRPLTPKGVLVTNAGQMHKKWLANVPRMLGAFITGAATRKRTRLSVQTWKPSDLAELAELVTAGTVTPVIDRTYPLGQTADAISYVGQGHAKGKVIITTEAPPRTHT